MTTDLTTDPRITAAREFLAVARKRPVGSLPPSVLARECAELRRILGQVLDVVSHAADPASSAALSPADVQTVLGALGIAARWADLTAGPREEHLDDTGTGAAYRALAARLVDGRRAQAPSGPCGSA